ncbi:MAG: hypothetical protein ACPLXL_01685 [Minisyncoccia bacterium]
MKISRQSLFNFSIGAIILVFLLIVLKSHQQVKAQNQIKVFPALYEIENSQKIGWENPLASLSLDLSSDAPFESFNKDNSAFLYQIKEEEIKQEGNEENQEQDLSENPLVSENLSQNQEATSSTGIVTGDSNVAVNLLNFVNTNFTQEQLITFILDNFSPLAGNIDLEEVFNQPINSFEIQFPNLAQLINNSSGEINNNINIQAITGYNNIEVEEGKVILKTGNANVALNVLNFLNTNFHQGNVAFIIVNNFNDWFGDLVFPGEKEWQAGSSNIVQQNNQNNSSEVNNQLNINATTGENEINGGNEESLIYTGQVNTNLNLFSLTNSNLNSSWFLGLFNNFGNWSGNVYSAPDSFYYSQLGNLMLLASGNGFNSSSYQMVSSSQADISNQINIEASTGDNTVKSGEDSSVVISTGNINLAVNLLNFANSNFEGRTGIVALINNYGNWIGDIAFG